MMNSYNLDNIREEAKEIMVPANGLEKMYRLQDVLAYINENEYMKDNLALKGGTALNYVFYNLPRLSLDIDLDFCDNLSKQEINEIRPQMINDIAEYMQKNGYTLSPHSKQPAALDSLVFAYNTYSNSTDTLKIEINYLLREHIMPTQMIEPRAFISKDGLSVRTNVIKLSKD